MRRITAALVLVVCAAATAACTNGSAPMPAPSASDAPSSPTPASTPRTSGVVLTTTVGTHDIEYRVGPLVNLGELSILPIHALSLTPPGDDPVKIGLAWADPWSIGASGVRLLDGDARTVEEAAQATPAGTSKPVQLHTSDFPLAVDDTEPLALYTVFGASDTATVDVIIPVGGLAADVPVIDIDELRVEEGGADYADTLVAALADIVGTHSDVNPQRSVLDSFTVSIDEATDTRATPDEVVVTVDTSVLFAADEATITHAADKILLSASTQFSSYPSGTLRVVGHTSTGGDESPAYNNDLSTRRAQAVHDRLKALIDLSGYDTAVDGRGLTEPRVEGASEAARAQNRRVELIFVPDAGAKAGAVEAPVFELAKSAGPTASGTDGVTVTNRDDAQVHVTLESVERRGTVLVGQVRIDHVAGKISGVGYWLVADIAHNVRGGLQFDLANAPSNLTLVAGDQRIYPLDYERGSVDEGGNTRYPMTDLFLSPELPDGGSFTTTVVWPDVFSGAADTTVTLDVHNPRAEHFHGFQPPFRLTDIPVIQ
ncbi:OmpA family protein [Homoserinimonas sp. OAct 916]|uniref:OmpA family protein n=1 Tax=Homoserinimonas sp. OAct 916 TaxID=2211450 RepID=UPI000DBE0E4B|nr:OmpA family protein [Homoserinimonas sp. OAct 916]